MYRQILLPLDGSKLAESAVGYASALAELSGASLVLLRAVQIHALPGRDPTAAQVAAVEQAAAYLDGQAAALRQRGLAVESSVYYCDPATAITEEAAYREIDLIVMATHGRTGLNRLLLGSVADRVAQTASVPVCLIPARASAGTALRGPILVTLDGSPLAETALAPAVELAQRLGTELILFESVPYPPTELAVAGVWVQEAMDEQCAETGRYLTGVADRLRTENPGLRVRALTDEGLAAEGILGCARQEDVGLLVMASHGRGGLTRLAYGSVASRVLPASPVPVLLVRVSQAAAEQAARSALTNA